MHRALFATLATITFLPLLLSPLDHNLPIWPLAGSFEEKARPALSGPDFLSKKFQSQLSTYLDSTFALRAVFIRFRNQIQRTVFGKIHGKKIVEGTDGYFYENDHVAAYLGTDFKEPAQTIHLIQRLRRVQDLLQQRQKTLLVILAPGKARIYPEHIPVDSPAPSEANYYNLLRREMQSQRVHHFDAIAYLKETMKDAPATFYPRAGTHWSVWGAAHVWQQVVNRTRDVSGRPIPSFTFHRGATTRLPRSDTTDSDLFDSMNLLWDLPWGHYVYPEVDRPKTDAVRKPPASLLAIGDSFYQTFFAFGGPQAVFPSSEFRFYNKIVFPGDGSPSRKSDEAPLADAIERADVIFLLVSEVNFKWFGYGFVEEAEQILEAR